MLPRLAATLAGLLNQREQAAAQIKEMLVAHPLAKVLTSMPGVGVRTGARLLLVTGCRQRLQQEILGHRGRKEDLLYRGRRTQLTRRSPLSQRGTDRLERLFAEREELIALEASYLLYQDVIDAYQHPDWRTGRRLMSALIDQLRTGIPEGLDELAQLGRTLWRKRGSNGPVEAINGRLEYLRGIDLCFRNFTHNVLHCLLHSGQLTARINAL